LRYFVQIIDSAKHSPFHRGDGASRHRLQMEEPIFMTPNEF